MMRKSFYTLADKCIKGITANEDVCMHNVLNSITIITYLNPILGYETCSAIAKEALASNRRVYDIILEKELISKVELDELLLPENMLY